MNKYIVYIDLDKVALKTRVDKKRRTSILMGVSDEKLECSLTIFNLHYIFYFKQLYIYFLI